MPQSTRALCKACEGNGVIKIPGGISTCGRCDGDCYEPATARTIIYPERHWAGCVEAAKVLRQYADIGIAHLTPDEAGAIVRHLIRTYLATTQNVQP